MPPSHSPARSGTSQMPRTGRTIQACLRQPLRTSAITSEGSHRYLLSFEALLEVAGRVQRGVSRSTQRFGASCAVCCPVSKCVETRSRGDEIEGRAGPGSDDIAGYYDTPANDRWIIYPG